MFSYPSPLSHHLDECEGAPTLQMGQTFGAAAQRQQTDDLHVWRSDIHGIDSELQFADIDHRVVQAMG